LLFNVKNNSLNRNFSNWFIFIALSLIWGSSFILMKAGMKSLSSIEVASLRIFSSGVIMIPLAFRAFRKIPFNKYFPVFLSGLFGSLFPAYLYCIAEEKVDSVLAGSLNSLTPIFVILIGAIFFRSKSHIRQILGILIAFSGSVLLFLNHSGVIPEVILRYIFMIILATFFYGLNVNLVNRFLSGIASVDIAAIALFLIALPAFILLLGTGYFHRNFSDFAVIEASSFALVLGVLGTALASIFFYILIQKSGMVFASMVTYCIPIVANIWGIFFGEQVGWLESFSLLIILSGVFLATSKPKLLGGKV